MSAPIRCTTAAPYVCDLHSHTTRSDGNDTPYELIEAAVERGLKVLAITDHDVLPPEQILPPNGSGVEICDFARTRGIILLRGIEYSCETEVQDVHVVGLGCRWDTPEMYREVARISASKAEAYLETIRRLNERGFPVDLEELLSGEGHAIPLEDLQKKRIFDYMARKGYAPDWSSAKLMVRDDPYLNVKREKPAALSIINSIHRAGGIAILAHPYLIDEEVKSGGQAIPRWQFIDSLIQGGLDGIELRYTYHKTTCKDRRPLPDIYEEIYRNVGGRLFFSGGSDYHAEHKKGIQDPRQLGECGLTWEEFRSVPVFRALVGG